MNSNVVPKDTLLLGLQRGSKNSASEYLQPDLKNDLFRHCGPDKNIASETVSRSTLAVKGQSIIMNHEKIDFHRFEHGR